MELAFINRILERANKDEDDVTYIARYGAGWKIGFDMMEGAMWPDDETEEYVSKTLGGGDIRYTQITLYSARDAEIMDPAFELGVKIENGKCVGVVPFLYEKQTIFSNEMIDLRDKDELNKRWNEFVNRMMA